VDPGNANSGMSSTFDWSGVDGTANNSDGSIKSTGVIFRASMVTTSSIKDGASNTYLLGERYLDPAFYNSDGGCDNSQGWDAGYSYDTQRWTVNPPAQDRFGYSDSGSGCSTIFGSPHSAGFNMALCDGSARAVSFGIDATLHRLLGSRCTSRLNPAEASYKALHSSDALK